MLNCKEVHFLKNLNNLKVEFLFFKIKITYGLYNKPQQNKGIKQKVKVPPVLGCPIHAPEVSTCSSDREQKCDYISLERKVMAAMNAWTHAASVLGFCF